MDIIKEWNLPKWTAKRKGGLDIKNPYKAFPHLFPSVLPSLIIMYF